MIFGFRTVGNAVIAVNPLVKPIVKPTVKPLVKPLVKPIANTNSSL